MGEMGREQIKGHASKSCPLCMDSVATIHSFIWPLSLPVAVFQRSGPWWSSVRPLVMSCLRKAAPLFSLAKHLLSMRPSTSLSHWLCSLSLTRTSTAEINSRTRDRAPEISACSCVPSDEDKQQIRQREREKAQMLKLIQSLVLNYYPSI